jgi:hypothetical protein
MGPCESFREVPVPQGKGVAEQGGGGMEGEMDII